MRQASEARHLLRLSCHLACQLCTWQSVQTSDSNHSPVPLSVSASSAPCFAPHLQTATTGFSSVTLFIVSDPVSSLCKEEVSARLLQHWGEEAQPLLRPGLVWKVGHGMG